MSTTLLLSPSLYIDNSVICRNLRHNYIYLCCHWTQSGECEWFRIDVACFAKHVHPYARGRQWRWRREVGMRLVQKEENGVDVLWMSIQKSQVRLIGLRPNWVTHKHWRFFSIVSHPHTHAAQNRSRIRGTGRFDFFLLFSFIRSFISAIGRETRDENDNVQNMTNR